MIQVGHHRAGYVLGHAVGQTDHRQLLDEGAVAVDILDLVGGVADRLGDGAIVPNSGVEKMLEVPLHLNVGVKVADAARRAPSSP